MTTTTAASGRKLTVAAAQLGTVHRTTPRAEVLSRLILMLEDAVAQGVKLLVYPETALTTFFPRYPGLDTSGELDSWFEHGPITQNANVAPLLQRAKELGVDIVFGYAEKTEDAHYYNTCSYIHHGAEVAKYRKVHLPGNRELYANPEATNQLERRYFEPGDLGFKAFRAPELCTTDEDGEAVIGMLICNDRRWAESWRCLGLQGVEIVCVGYNTPSWAADMLGHSEDADPKYVRQQQEFHHLLVMQAHSYTNATFSISAAHSGLDDGKYGLIGCSTIIDPQGNIVAQSRGTEDELVVATIDLDEAKECKKTVFNFEEHRQPQHYSLIVEQAGVVPPPRLIEIIR